MAGTGIFGGENVKIEQGPAAPAKNHMKHRQGKDACEGGDLLRLAAKQFGVDQPFVPAGHGHINDTYVSEDGCFVLQRINTEVFRDPAALMDNIDAVTSHLRHKGLLLGEDVRHTVLNFYRTKDGALFAEEQGRYYRMARFIQDSVVIEPGSCGADDLRECGLGFGRFLDRLSDFDASVLTETIPDFHNTPKRIRDLWDAARQDPFGRAAETGSELDFVRQYEDRISLITDGLAEGSIPLCVTHNDTKINNILFDAGSRRALCVIDLDTVMPGSRLCDYGDALRTAAATAAEDEADLSRVGVNMRAVRAFTEGFLEETGEVLAPRERELLPASFLLMTLECGVRFLEDYLRGDVYFKTDRPGHNLDRARNQFEMVRKIDGLQQEMAAMIRGLS